MKTEVFIQGSDNFGYLIVEGARAIAVDPLDPKPYLELLEKNQASLEAILVTHYHADHTAGVAELKAAGAKVYGPHATRIPPFVDFPIEGDSSLTMGPFNIEVFMGPGHSETLAMYYFPKKKQLFVGDLLFHLSCGRVVDGDAEDLFWSLQRLKSFPIDTEILVGHDYREKNLAFAQHLDPSYYARLSLDDLDKTTSLEMELWWNPFLRMSTFQDWAQLRKMRDMF